MHGGFKKVLAGHCQILDPVGDAVAFPKSYGILERPAHSVWQAAAGLLLLFFL
jgi:hypothetical protein